MCSFLASAARNHRPLCTADRLDSIAGYGIDENNSRAGNDRPGLVGNNAVD